LDARRAGSPAFDPAMRLVVLPEKPKRYDLLPAAVTVEPAGRDAFAFSAGHPAFFVRPEAETFSGAFEDASFLLLPGEKRVVRYRSFDGRIPAVEDLTVAHLAETWR
jgi:beta-mannosidase